MSVEIEEMVRSYAQHQDRLAPPVTAAEARARAEQSAAGDGATRTTTEPDGPTRERGYLVEPREREMVTFAKPRAPRRRVIAVLAAVAAVTVVTVAVAVTRPGAHHQPEPPVAPPPSPTTVARPQLYWRDQGGIGRANLDGTDVVPSRELIPVGGWQGPCALAVDNNYVYWGSDRPVVSGDGTLGRAKRDGTGVDNNFIGTGPYTARCVVTDGAHVYWTGYTVPGNKTTIGRANLDGTGAEESIIPGINSTAAFSAPCGLAVDGTHVYWGGDSNGTAVGRANLDGTGVIRDFITGVGKPTCGLVIDGGHIYWGTSNGTIGRANLDGSGVNDSFIRGPSLSGLFPVPCAADGTYIYWTLIGPPTPWIGRARLDGTDVQADFINVHPDLATVSASPDGCAIGG
jgi:hypothetical protein